MTFILLLLFWLRESSPENAESQRDHNFGRNRGVVVSLAVSIYTIVLTMRRLDSDGTHKADTGYDGVGMLY